MSGWVNEQYTKWVKVPVVPNDYIIQRLTRIGSKRALTRRESIILERAIERELAGTTRPDYIRTDQPGD